jgi:hypothetical protein
MNRIPSEAVASPGAWTGRDLELQPQAWTCALSPEDRADLLEALERMRRDPPPLERVSQRDFELPRLGPKLRRLAHDISDGIGFVLIRGFPTDGLTPDDITLMYFACLTHVGIPIAQSSRNDLVGHVRDEGGSTPNTRGYQTNKALGYHSDSADLVSLFCVRPALSGGRSRILSAVTIHNAIQNERPDLLRVLYDEPFYCSWSGQQPSGQAPYYWTRFFSWHGGRLHTSGIKEKYAEWPVMSAAQQEAIGFVRDLVSRREDELVLNMEFQPGDVQILDNSIVWHSRTGFVDHPDPEQRRHLLRVWLNYYDERPVAPDFSNRYDMVGQRTSTPKRKLFDVEVYDTW